MTIPDILLSRRKPLRNLFRLAVLGAWMVVAPVSPAASETTHAQIPSTAAATEAYGKLSLSFEANHGQADRRVKFLARGPGYNVLLTPTEAVVGLRRSMKNSRAASSDVKTGHAALRMRLIGANAKPEMTGLDRLPGKANYFIGNDPKKWRTDIPTYARVEYRHVYPGVDLIYYGNQRQLEYDFVVSPGADPRAIRLAFQGTDAIRLEDNGDLLLHIGSGQVRFRKPALYQETGRGREAVEGGYVVTGPTQVAFNVGAYDASRPLVIDPVTALSYSTYLGGTGADQSNAIAVDAAGNAYVTGQTASSDFQTFPPLPASVIQRTSQGSGDAFVTKLNAAGSALVYSTYLGGSLADSGAGIAVDSAGNAYVTGTTSSSNFPTTPSAFDSSLNSAGIPDAFVTKLNATGSALVYSTYLGAAGSDEGTAIAVDSSNRIYVTGHTNSSGFPTTPGSFQTIFQGGGSDAFVAKLDPSLAAPLSLVYSTYLGGNLQDSGSGIAVDAAGNAYVTGTTSSVNFPTAAALQGNLGVGGLSDAFVTKLNAAGSALVYSTYLGGTGIDSGAGIAVDAVGNVYVTGTTSSVNFPTAAALQGTRGGPSDAFVTKLNAAGSALVYSTYLGGTGIDSGAGIAVDVVGNVYVTGSTASTTDFPTAHPFQASNGGLTDAFFTKIDPSASGAASLVYSTYLGGSGDDSGAGIAVDAAGAAYMTGSTTSANFPTATPVHSTLGGISDAFVSKLLDTFSPGTIQFSAATYSVAENVAGGKATITVTRPGGFAGGVTVHYATSDGTATSVVGPGQDYTTSSGTLTFAVGVTSQTFTIPIFNDNVPEANETVNLTLSNPTPTGPGGAVLGAQSTAVLTILNDDPSGVFQFEQTSYTAREGDGSINITVKRASPSGPATVDYAVTGGTATGGGVDYTLAAGTLTFNAGDSSKTITILITDDAVSEAAETINLALSNPSPGATLGTQTTAVVTIQDNDPPGLRFSQAAFSVLENSPTATITVTRVVGDVSVPIGVSYAASDGTALLGVNYGVPSGIGPFSFGPGVVSQTFTIPIGIFNDTIVNVDRTVNLSLNTPTGGAFLDVPNTAVLTIVNDDVAGSLQFSTATYSVSEAGPAATITVTRTGGSAGGVTVNYAATGGTATGGNVDYALVPGTLTFGPGSTFQTFLIPIVDDALAEGNETITLALSSPAPTGLPGAATLGAQSTATVTILDNEQGFQFSAPTYSVSEAGATIPITVVRFGPATGTVGVSYATSNGTAIAGTDYTAASGTLSFGPGVTSRAFNIPVKNDTLADGNRTVNLTLSSPTPLGVAGLGPQSAAVLTIQDNDVAGTVQFSAPTYTLTEAGGKVTITVTRTGGSASGVTVNYAVTGGSAILNTDYGPLSGTGTLTFGSGVLSQTFTVPILKDTVVDGSKTVNLALSSPGGGASLGAPNTAVVTITDINTPGVIQFSAATYTVSEATAAINITVKRTGTNLASGITVDYVVTGGTATGGGVDYTLANGTLTFGAGETSKTFPIQIINDTIAEGPETVLLALQNPTVPATLGVPNTATLTITDNDVGGAIKFSTATYSVAENVAGGTTNLTVTRTGGVASGVTVDYAVTGGTATGGGVDYMLAAGTLTFNAGVTSLPIPVTINDDSIAEGNETVVVTLSNPTGGNPLGGATLGTPSVTTLTIVDNDVTQGLLQFSAATYSVKENVAGGVATITVTRTGAPALGLQVPITVQYTTSDGTASSTVGPGQDYTATSGTLTFNPGITSRTFTIPIIDDAVHEVSETVNLTLSNPVGGAGIGARRTAVLIVDND